MTVVRASRPGLAVAALGAILAISAAWWALALWPLAATAPEWIARTREVCFGATATGLPHAGGWILLIGEPIGMLLILRVVWGEELRAGLRALHSAPAGRFAGGAVMLAVAVGASAAALRVSTAMQDAEPDYFAVNTPLPARSDLAPPPLALIDQHGARVTLAAVRGEWAVVTFAFGHCDDICPVIVETVKQARRDTGMEQVPLLIVTLDPWRDTPERLTSIAAGWTLSAHDRVLSGTIGEVNSALDEWRIARARDPETGFVSHGSMVAVIDPAGRLAWRLDGSPQRIREALTLAAGR